MTTDSPRPDKVAVVTEVRERLEAADAVVLTEYRGLDVSAMAQLRGALREVGGEYKVYKNTLVRLAATELGLDLDELLTGPTALAFVGPGPDGSPGDAAALAKALADFGRTHDALVIKGGVLEATVLGTDQVKALASLPGRDQLLAEFAGSMEYLYQSFAGLLDAKLREFSYALQELLDKGGPAGDTAPAAPADTGGDEETGADAAEAPADTETTDEAAEPAAETTDDAVDETADTSEEE